MDSVKEHQTIETLPGFKPLEIVEHSTGYHFDLKIDGIVIGFIDEGFRYQYRAHIENHFCINHGRFHSYDYFKQHDDAVRFIRDQWVLFLQHLQVIHPIGCICVECEAKEMRKECELRKKYELG